MNKNIVKVISRINQIVENGEVVTDVNFIDSSGVRVTGAKISEFISVESEIQEIQIPSKCANNEERAIIEMMKNRDRHDSTFASDYMQAVGQGYDGSIDIMEDIFGISEFDIIEMFHDVE